MTTEAIEILNRCLLQAQNAAVETAKRIKLLEAALWEIADRTGQGEGAETVEGALKLLGWANGAACSALGASFSDEDSPLAAKEHELALMRKTLDWCLKHAAYNTASGVLSAQGPFLEAVPIPEDIAEIVNSRQP